MRRAGTDRSSALDNETLRLVAVTGGDPAVWPHIGSTRERREAAWPQSAGRILAGLDGIRLLPLDSLQPLARDPEPSPLPADVLADCLRRAFVELGRAWPEGEREVRYFVRAVIAGQMPPGRQMSGSSEQCPFAVRIDFCPTDPVAMLADALVHEAAHVKLRLSGLVRELCGIDTTPRLHHPWRPELRPLSGVLVASHAFVAVHGFHARRRALRLGPDADRLEAAMREDVRQALDTLMRDSQLTSAGHAFAAVMKNAFEAHCHLADGSSTDLE
jgi:HEXXH motif-containing protein